MESSPTSHDVDSQDRAGDRAESASVATSAGTEDFRYVFDNSAVPQSITSVHGEVQVNDAFLRLLGYTRDESLALGTWQSITHPDDLAESDALVKVLTSGKRDHVRFEKRFIAKDGSVIWGEVNTRLRRSDAGEPLYFMTAVFDITERKRIQHELEQSEAKFATAFRTSPDAINITRLSDGLYLDSNDGFTRLFGYSAEDIAGKTSIDIHMWGDLEDRDEFTAQLRQHGSVHEFETRLRRKDGAQIDVLVSSEVVDIDGEECILSVTRDITERKLHEESLRISEERHRAISSHTPDHVVIQDSDLRYTYVVNPQLNLTEADYLGHTDYDVLAPDDAERITVIKREVLETGMPYDVQEAVVNSAGKAEYFESVYVPTLGVDGRPCGLIGYLRNVTDRKIAEAALRESYEMITRLTDQVPGVVYQYRVNPDGSSAFPFSSRGMEDIYEYSPEEVREDATPVFGRLHPDDVDRVSALISESARTLEPFHCEFRVVLPRQGLRWRLSDAIPQRMEDGGTMWYGIISDVTERVVSDQDLQRTRTRLEESLRGIIETMGKVVEARDPYTQGHEVGVARISRLIADELGLPSHDVEGIEVAALLHDIGKLTVPAEILTKPGTLSSLEFDLIKLHSQAGYNILKDIEFDWPIAEMVLQHHERMDGSGYPRGLKGDEISAGARILMVADVLDAMSAYRPYRPALGMDAALKEITEHPECYDSATAKACLRLNEAGLLQATAQ